MRYWIISPNVLDNPTNYPVSDFVEIMKKKHICLLGRKDDKKFKNDVNLGDIVIVSQRVRWIRHNYFAGIVDSDAYLYNYDESHTLQARKLKYFTLLDNKDLSFEGCSNEGTKRIHAIYELKENKNKNKPQDKRLIDKILNYIKNTKMDYEMKKYAELLKENYNLILTGAPGTGKTYLAKQIAAKMIFDEEYTEEFEEDENFKNQCKFVQFHPSYDYTDFVEGLRPIKDNDIICFERKDGVFKEFCKKALKNLIDSKKDIPELNREAVIKKHLIKFANEIYEEFNKNNIIELKGIRDKPVAPFTNIEFNEEEETLLMVAEAKNKYPINGYMNQYVDWYKKYKEFQEQGKLTTHNMGKKVGFGGRISYLCAILKNFDEKYNSKIEEKLKNDAITVEKIERKNFVFIIDEINRGEISKIFGELFFAIDPVYRGIKGKVLTQYSNLIDEEEEKYFYIPENVYIIGTMNDIDRSVESMDFAMRRRFAFKEIKAKDTQENILKSLDDSIKQDAIDRMDNLNKAIEKIEDFNSSYHIGASYFLKLKNYYENSNGNKEEAFKSLWENHLKGLLFEYLRGMPDAESKLKELENAYNVISANSALPSNTEQDSDSNDNIGN